MKTSQFFVRFSAILVTFVGVFFVWHTVQAYTYTEMLYLGSTGASVTSLQERLGVPVTGTFDYATRGAVVVFQASEGLTADGVVGPETGALLALPVPKPTPAASASSSSASQSTSQTLTQTTTTTQQQRGVTYFGTVTSVSHPSSSASLSGCTSDTGFSATTGTPCNGSDQALPAGCTDTSDYSATTGLPCNGPAYPEGCISADGFSVTSGLPCSLPIGCLATTGFSAITGDPCNGSSLYVPLVPGCASHEGYSATTGQSCLTGNTAIQLHGDDGDLDNVTLDSGYSGIQVQEDRTDADIAAYTFSADSGSDLLITSVKINLEFTGGDASTNLNQYIETVHILDDGEEVGSADVSDFSKDDGAYTILIPLTNAVVYANDQATFSVSVDTVDNIVSDDADNTWTLTLDQVRYVDASGENFTETSQGDIGSDGATSFHFQPVIN